MTTDLTSTAGVVVDTGRRHGTFHPLRVAAIERLTDDAVAITFAVPAELRDDYAFDAGQHLTLRTEVDGTEVRRNYSICAPAGRPLRIGVKRLAGGVFSGYATSTLQGRRRGRRDDADRSLHHRTSSRPRPGTTARWRRAAASRRCCRSWRRCSRSSPRARFTLVYGNRTAASVMFLEELADLKDRYPGRFQLLHVLSREQQESELLCGRLDPPRLRRLLAALLPPESVDEWFLCGPYAMVEGAREVLLEAGRRRGRTSTPSCSTSRARRRASRCRPSRSAPRAPARWW